MISELISKIVIQKSSVEMDDVGNQVLLWQDYYRCAAYANNLSGSEYWAAAQTNSQKDVYFVVRYCSEVSVIDTENYRIIFRGQIYNITFIDNVKYENKMLKIRASLVKEETDADSGS